MIVDREWRCEEEMSHCDICTHHKVYDSNDLTVFLAKSTSCYMFWISLLYWWNTYLHHYNVTQYVWEQTGFDILQRKTRISLHYNLQKPQRKIRHAFSYEWRLWVFYVTAIADILFRRLLVLISEEQYN